MTADGFVAGTLNSAAAFSIAVVLSAASISPSQEALLAILLTFQFVGLAVPVPFPSPHSRLQGKCLQPKDPPFVS
jgi:hypothetical protein